MGLALGTVLRRVPPKYSERESRTAKPELATCEDFSVGRNPRASCEMEHPQSVLRYRFAAEAHRSVLRKLLIFRHLRWPVSGSHQVYCSVIIAGENWDAAYIAIGVCSSVPQRALPRISSDSHSTQNKRFFTWIFSTPGRPRLPAAQKRPRHHLQCRGLSLRLCRPPQDDWCVRRAHIGSQLDSWRSDAQHKYAAKFRREFTRSTRKSGVVTGNRSVATARLQKPNLSRTAKAKVHNQLAATGCAALHQVLPKLCPFHRDNPLASRCTGLLAVALLRWLMYL